MNRPRVPEWLIHNKCRHVLSVTLLTLKEREGERGREEEGGHERKRSLKEK